ncbi:MAG: sodium:solute symporter family transporter [Planctomycetota bacterium]
MNAYPTRMPQLDALDWIVIAAYAALVLYVGIWAGRGHQSADDLTLGKRNFSVWVVVLSMIGTELSAATFISVPEFGYLRDWGYLQFAFGALVGKCLIAYTFIPLYHRLGVVTVYGFIDQRFGPGARQGTALCFVLGRLLASGVRLFIAGLAFAVVTGLDLKLTIVICGVVVGIYTLTGGIRAVIWTDAVQVGVLLTAALVTLYVVATRWDGGLAGVLDWASANGKTRVFQFPPMEPFFDNFIAKATPFWVALIGGAALTLATHATDHDMVQRLLTTRDGRRGGHALIASGLCTFPITLLFLLIGTALAAFYSQPANFNYDISDHPRIFPIFAMHELPSGLRGLLFAGLFAVAMSSLSSAICALATTIATDLVPKRIATARGVAVIRYCSLGVTALLIGSAVLADYYYHNFKAKEFDVIEMALFSISIFFGGLLGVFLLGILTRDRGSSLSVNLALVGGALIGVGLALQKPFFGEVLVAWPWWIVISATFAYGIAAATGTPARARAGGKT